MQRLLTMADVTEMTSLTRQHVHKMIREGDFPAPFKLTKRTIRWYAAEIDDFIASRPRTGQQEAA